MKKDHKINKKGFILVEMLVAIFLFTIVMLVSMTAVLALLDVNKKNQSTKSVINNLNLVVNSIVKSLAVSNGYYCGLADTGYNGSAGANCSDPQGSITFRTPSNSTIRYKFISQNTSSPGQILRSINSDTDYIPITSPEINVTGLKFYVYDTALLTAPSTGDIKQPRVVMIVQGTAGTKDNTKTQFNIQTTVSQRKLDATF